MNTTASPASKVAFVFEGGGSLAATQIGMLRALTEDRPRPELVIGTSAGAINAVAFAADPSAAGVAELETLWLSLHRRDLLATLRALLDDHFADRRLEDVQVPAHVVTTDLASGAAHVISAGPVVEALLASAAIPGVFPPVTIDGRQLVDGAAAANTPVRQAADLGATDIYVLAVATLARTGEPTALADPAVSALGHMADAGTARHPQHSPVRVHLIPAPQSPTGNILDFRHSSQLMAESYQLTRRWLAEAQPAAAPAA
jgi:NTE family protein